jgi:metal-responsive CopG/Arc/MetJ family transcriptional regulator
MSTKVTSLRLEERLSAEVNAVARAEGQSVSDLVRDALRRHVDDRKSDPVFQKRLRGQLERDRELAEGLLGP